MTHKNIHQSKIFDSLKLVELTNGRKTKLQVLNYGAAIFSLEFLRDSGEYLNVLVSPEKPEDFLSQAYKEHNQCFGASVGRYAGRISQGGFELNGEHYPLYTKTGVHLHGGKLGFTYKFWEIEEVTKRPNPSVKFSYLSKDGEEGYPGNLQVSVIYTLTEEDEVLIEYTAVTDKDTVINLTNHAYFNLNGGGDIKDHLMKLNAKEVLEVSEELMPTGDLRNIRNSGMDFTSLRPIGEATLDDVYVLGDTAGRGENIFLKGSKSGISLEIESNQPAVVVFIPEKLPDAWEYQTSIAKTKPSVCLESQNFPDAPHHPQFPSSVLRPGETYRNSIKWTFRK